VETLDVAFGFLILTGGNFRLNHKFEKTNAQLLGALEFLNDFDEYLVDLTIASNQEKFCQSILE
jgi:hypothetical protein